MMTAWRHGRKKLRSHILDHEHKSVPTASRRMLPFSKLRSPPMTYFCHSRLHPPNLSIQLLQYGANIQMSKIMGREPCLIQTKTQGALFVEAGKEGWRWGSALGKMYSDTATMRGCSSKSSPTHKELLWDRHQPLVDMYISFHWFLINHFHSSFFQHS
jgi:hypothetical protein